VQPNGRDVKRGRPVNTREASARGKREKQESVRGKKTKNSKTPPANPAKLKPGEGKKGKRAYRRSIRKRAQQGGGWFVSMPGETFLDTRLNTCPGPTDAGKEKLIQYLQEAQTTKAGFPKMSRVA